MSHHINFVVYNIIVQYSYMERNMRQASAAPYESHTDVLNKNLYVCMHTSFCKYNSVIANNELHVMKCHVGLLPACVG